MQRYLARFVIFCAFAGHAVIGMAGTPTPASLDLVDLTDDFATFVAGHRDLPDEERISDFYDTFEALIPGYYSGERNFFPDGEYDELLIRALDGYSENGKAIENTAQNFRALFQPAVASFEAELGPVESARPIFLVHSLGAMDGGTRDLPGGTALIFGVDVIARIHDPDALQPFFHHELFHLYHAGRFGECETMWCALWQEGLAVYAAETLNPGASDAELLLTRPEPLRPAVEAHFAEAICAIVERLAADDGDTYGRLFSSQRLNPRLPPRFGYYVGYLVAQRAGETRSLDELAVLTQEQTLPLVTSILADMAVCPEMPADQS